MLFRKCDMCGNEIQPFATELEPKEDSDNGFFRLYLDDYTKFASEKGYPLRKYVDICPCCFSESMDGSNGSFILRKLIGPNYDWHNIGFIVK